MEISLPYRTAFAEASPKATPIYAMDGPEENFQNLFPLLSNVPKVREDQKAIIKLGDYIEKGEIKSFYEGLHKFQALDKKNALSLYSTLFRIVNQELAKHGLKKDNQEVIRRVLLKQALGNQFKPADLAKAINKYNFNTPESKKINSSLEWEVLKRKLLIGGMSVVALLATFQLYRSMGTTPPPIPPAVQPNVVVPPVVPVVPEAPAAEPEPVLTTGEYLASLPGYIAKQMAMFPLRVTYEIGKFGVSNVVVPVGKWAISNPYVTFPTILILKDTQVGSIVAKKLKLGKIASFAKDYKDVATTITGLGLLGMLMTSPAMDYGVRIAGYGYVIFTLHKGLKRHF